MASKTAMLAKLAAMDDTQLEAAARKVADIAFKTVYDAGSARRRQLMDDHRGMLLGDLRKNFELALFAKRLEARRPEPEAPAAPPTATELTLDEARSLMEQLWPMYLDASGVKLERLSFAPRLKEGALGGPGYLERPWSERKALLDDSVRRDGYRSTLGRVAFLERNRTIKARHGTELAHDRAYLVETYGGPGSFGPRAVEHLRTVPQWDDTDGERVERMAAAKLTARSSKHAIEAYAHHIAARLKRGLTRDQIVAKLASSMGDALAERVADIVWQLREAGSTATIDQPNYRFYVVDDRGGSPKIDTGWEYREDANDRRRDLAEDYETRGEAPGAKVYTRSFLVDRLGLDPENDANWLTSN